MRYIEKDPTGWYDIREKLGLSGISIWQLIRATDVFLNDPQTRNELPDEEQYIGIRKELNQYLQFLKMNLKRIQGELLHMVMNLSENMQRMYCGIWPSSEEPIGARWKFFLQKSQPFDLGELMDVQREYKIQEEEETEQQRKRKRNQD